MLGLDSNINLSGQISIVSKCSKDQVLPMENLQIRSIESWNKNNPSTNIASDVSQKSQKIRKLKAQIRNLENQQRTMSTKLESYVKIIEKELQKKSEHNKLMQTQISECKKQLEESQADIKTLTTIIACKKKATPQVTSTQKVKRTHFRHISKFQNKASSPIQQHSINSLNKRKSIQEKEKLTSIEEKTQKKSPSSRLQLLAQAKRISPKPNQDLSTAQSSKRLSPRVYKKIKSPFRF